MPEIGEVWEFMHENSPCYLERWEILDIESNGWIIAECVRENALDHAGIPNSHLHKVHGGAMSISLNWVPHGWRLVADSFTTWVRKVRREEGVSVG